MVTATYRLSTYDPGDAPHDDWIWTVRRRGLSRWRLRGAIREYRARGYEDELSLLVEREE